MENPIPHSTKPSAVDCGGIPAKVAEFIDTFVDFSVSGGLFLPPEPLPLKKQDSPLQTVFPQPKRLIAIGDIHGDLKKAKQALRLAKLIDKEERWSGGTATVVQVGDIFDRGGDEIKLMYFFEKLKREAAKAGGLLITMNGNHEIMNVNGDFRFATPEGFAEFENWAMWQLTGNRMKKMCDGMDKFLINDLFNELPSEIPRVQPEFQNAAKARFAALRPNGLIANRFLSKNQTVVIVGDSVFAHGGLLKDHILYGLDRVNDEVRDWIRGRRNKVAHDLVRGKNSIVWLRKFSYETAEDCDCSLLEHALNSIPGVRRMIMGHTIQRDGINGVCDNMAIRVDVGMSKVCGDRFPEVLEINDRSELRILTANPFYLKREYKSEVDMLIPETRGTSKVEVNA